MNILMFNYEYPPLGGGGGVAHELIAEALARRHRVVVVTSGYRDLPDRETRGDVEILRVPVWGRKELAVASIPSMLTFPAATRRIYDALDSESFDLVTGFFAVPTGPASVAYAKRKRLPHVVSTLGGDIYDPSKTMSPHRIPPLKWAVRNVLRDSARIIADSDDTRENIARYYGRVGDVDVIRLGIRRVSPPPATRSELGLPEDVFLTTTVGRLVPRKGLDRLIRVLAAPELGQVHLAIMGSGPERAALERLARSEGVADRVRFMGWVDEETKWQVMRVADAFVTATLHEGYGLMFLEAMAEGLPIVAPDHGGHTDFLTDGVTGFLTPAGDEEALRAAIARVSTDEELRQRVGDTNRRLFDEEHDIEPCAAAYEAVFEEVLGR